MCMQSTQVRAHQRWNWAGDEIVHDAIVPAARRIPGSGKKNYPIDIRQFLSGEGNGVIRKEVEQIRKELPPAEQRDFSSRAKGSFDLRKDVILSYFSRFLHKPVGRGMENWLFPEETLALKYGDCEDLAFLLASLLEASGISPYCIRVALGSLIERDAEGERSTDHAWVVYKDERGGWEILEPLTSCKRGSRSRSSEERGRTPSAILRSARQLKEYEYVPHFVFNRQHLWRVRSPRVRASVGLRRYVGDRSFWKHIDPAFAAKVHESIFDSAFGGMPAAFLRRVKSESFWVDVDTLNYDPRDHFDFSYVDESWAKIDERLATGDRGDFALAAHAIADFYAHTVYAEFAPRKHDGTIEIYDPGAPPDLSHVEYDFRPYAPLPGCKKSLPEAQKHWKGKIISGQWWRWYSTFPDDLQYAADFPAHRCLPDHDLLAVDGPNPPDPPHRYSDRAVFLQQFALRRAAAVEHLSKVWREWKQTHGAGGAVNP